MTIEVDTRAPDSPYVETVMYGRTVAAAAPIRPAEPHWHMVFVTHAGMTRALVVGPLTSAGTVTYGAGAEILWVKFRLGVCMPHLPLRRCLDAETPLPETAGRAFWLNSAAWQFPTYENVETFISRLVRQDILTCDPVVQAVLQGQQPDLSPRTVRHRFRHATGITQNQLFQIERAQQAADLLLQGVSILDTVDQAGYYDQPHLTRSLKQWIGYTPAQLLPQRQPA